MKIATTFVYSIISLLRWGVVSYADSLDCVGIIGKNVEHIEKTFGMLCDWD